MKKSTRENERVLQVDMLNREESEEDSEDENDLVHTEQSGLSKEEKREDRAHKWFSHVSPAHFMIYYILIIVIGLL